MTETKTTAKRPTAKEKRVRHANAQASYMERKRAEGKEWLATWVPGEAKDTFRTLAKYANEDDSTPGAEYVDTIEEALGEAVPDWAKQSQTLLNLWLISHTEVSINLTGPGKKDKDKKKKKKKKK